MIVKLEEEIRSDFEGYQILLKIISDVENSKDSDVVFDFERVMFFEANLSAVLGTIVELIENKSKNVIFENISLSMQLILRKNNFLTEYGYESHFDTHNTAIKYKKFDPLNKEDDNNFETYIQNQLLNKKDFPSHSKRLGKQITEKIFELYENARTHGLCKLIHTCGQYFPHKEGKPLNFTIVDTGVNFKENVSKFLKKEFNALEAIEWAMKYGNTTKSGDKPGGLGLDLIFQFIKHNKGKIQIISSNGFWEWHEGKIDMRILDKPFPGTIANLRFNFDDKSHYVLAHENIDWDNIF